MSLAGIPAISIPGGLSRGPAGRHPARRPGVQREPDPRRRATRSSRRSASTERRGGDDRRRSAEREYEPVIGLEIHVQLATRTKMFCGCELSFGEPPNTRTCPICLGHPGHAAGDQRARPSTSALMIAHGARLRDRAAVDLPPQELLLSRPAQGLPDLPVRHPAALAAAGWATCASTACTSRRTPPSSSTPASSGRIHGAEASVVDFNRGGTPLVEIVTEPDIRSPAQARRVGAPAARDAEAPPASPT